MIAEFIQRNANWLVPILLAVIVLLLAIIGQWLIERTCRPPQAMRTADKKRIERETQQLWQRSHASARRSWDETYSQRQVRAADLGAKQSPPTDTGTEARQP